MTTEIKVNTIKSLSGFLEAHLTNYGATMTHLLVNFGDKIVDVVAGCDRPEDYVKLGSLQNPYFGCVLNGKRFQLPVNNGPNSLHGGLVGFDKKVWRIEKESADYVEYSLISEDDDQGYPGTLAATVAYSFTDEQSLRIDYTVQLLEGEASIVNLTNHSYFNLSGFEDSVLGHKLEIPSTKMLSMNSNQIPMGASQIELKSPFDFSIGKTIGKDLEKVQQFRGFDHFFMNHSFPCDVPQVVAALSFDHLRMEVLTDFSGFQLYSSNWLDGSIPTKSSQPPGFYEKYGSVCIEASHPPDAINTKEYRDLVTIEKGQVKRNTTIYRFTIRK